MEYRHIPFEKSTPHDEILKYNHFHPWKKSVNGIALSQNGELTFGKMRILNLDAIA